MASEKPTKISKIIQEVPDTDNLSAIDDLVYALGSMPPKIAARHSEVVIGWMEKGTLSYRAEPYIEYALLLAKNNFNEEALGIVKKLLTPELPDNPLEEFGLGRNISSTNLKISDYEFRTFFNENMPSLLPHLGFNLIKLLAEILNNVLAYSYENPPADMSHMWKQEINFEDPDYTGYRHEIKETLVDAIASLTDYLIREGNATIQEATSFFDSYDWSIFRRLSALLCSRQESMKDIRSILLDKDNFEDYSIRYEYRLLLEGHYPSLTKDEQEIILLWIDEGPNRKDVVQFLEQRDVEPTDEKIAAYVQRWQRRKLFPISKYLEGDRKSYYNELIDEHGEPDFETSGVRSFVGPTTPKTIPELQELSVSDLVNYLQSWQPEEGFAQPTPEGLGRALHSVIADNADEFSQHALLFKSLEPTYVRALFEGFRIAVGNGTPIHWEPVLELAEWVLEQPLDKPNDELYRSKDPGWGWCRSTIASVLEQGCQAKSSTIPFQYREGVWGCLAILAEDPNPDEDHEEKYGGDNMDPSTLSINTTRGKAMYAVFAYGWWVKRHQKDKEENIEFSFDNMPEVRMVLESHLDLDHDPSLAIRSVYGQHMPDIVSFDTEWSQNNLYDIFPLEEKYQSYFTSAWNTYIKYNKPWEDVFEIMSPIYQEAIDLMTKIDNKPHLHSDQRFVEHLVVLYWWGIIDLDKTHTELLKSFWKQAPSELRKHAFGYTGRCLSEWAEATNPDIADKIYDYIEHRINAAKESDNTNHYKEELVGFGWCFTSVALDKEKRIQYLTEILRLTKEVDQSHSVMETLNNEFVDQYPEEVLECIQLIVKGTNKNINFLGWKNDLKKILKSLLEEKEPIAKKASGLVQYICQRSYHLMQEFKPLLD